MTATTTRPHAKPAPPQLPPSASHVPTALRVSVRARVRGASSRRSARIPPPHRIVCVCARALVRGCVGALCVCARVCLCVWSYPP